MAGYGLSVFVRFRVLERRLPAARDRWARLESALLASFDHLQNGDLVRSIEDAQRLPQRLAGRTQAASEALADLARKIQDSSIQIAGGTEPIVLHRDAVSGGGYFMVGTVISADMDLIGQLQPNKKVRFVAVDMDGALAARHDYAATLAQIRDAV